MAKTLETIAFELMGLSFNHDSYEFMDCYGNPYCKDVHHSTNAINAFMSDIRTFEDVHNFIIAFKESLCDEDDFELIQNLDLLTNELNQLC